MNGMKNIHNIDSLNDDELFDLLDQIDMINENQNSSKLFCKTCNTNDTISEDTAQGIIVCIGCGSILADLFDTTLESRQYDNDNNTVARCSSTTNHFLPQSSLGTSIRGIKRNKVRLLHSWSAMPYRERSLNAVLKQIQAKCNQAGIIKCIEDDAKILYKNISESKHAYGKNSGKTVIIRGINRRALVASCVFYACKKKGNTRSPKEIAKLFDLSYKDITKGYKLFLKFVLKQIQIEDKITNPEDFITRYCRELHVKNNHIDQAIQIAKNIQKLDIASTHTPFSVATSSIVLMLDLNKFNFDRKYIAKKFNVSDVTITKTYKKIEKYKDILTNDELCNQLANKMEEERKKINIPEKLKSIYENNTNNDDLCENNNIIFFERKFNIENENLDEYITDIEADLYDKLSQTDDEYENIFN
ncbi:transcription initiation factor IIB [Indivirus ILV1]|uniref:Transcription initiation factor IIB n=1 Tax=Indivirus ILV1 TaxID=1977633 RepID=A0A1V0SCN9_9VIRU|nr:transcription initiation factor IIB [Indivirus ILV1]